TKSSRITSANGVNGNGRPIVEENIQSAKEAGLIYFGDDTPGISRLRKEKRFIYKNPSGKIIREWETLVRIKHLAIPPAWTDVWICPSPRGHIQAVGRDARGRKQYRYHPDWHARRDEAKYER